MDPQSSLDPSAGSMHLQESTSDDEIQQSRPITPLTNHPVINNPIPKPQDSELVNQSVIFSSDDYSLRPPSSRRSASKGATGQCTYTCHSCAIFSVEQAIAILDYIGSETDSEMCLPFALRIVENGELVIIAEDNGEFSMGELLLESLSPQLQDYNVLICMSRKLTNCCVHDMCQRQKRMVAKNAAKEAVFLLADHLHGHSKTSISRQSLMDGNDHSASMGKDFSVLSLPNFSDVFRHVNPTPPSNVTTQGGVLEKMLANVLGEESAIPKQGTPQWRIQSQAARRKDGMNEMNSGGNASTKKFIRPTKVSFDLSQIIPFSSTEEAAKSKPSVPKGSKQHSSSVRNKMAKILTQRVQANDIK